MTKLNTDMRHGFPVRSAYAPSTSTRAVLLPQKSITGGHTIVVRTQDEPKNNVFPSVYAPYFDLITITQFRLERGEKKH